MKEAIAKKNHELVFLYNLNLVDEVWNRMRPKPPEKPIRVHDLKYAGLDAASKLSFLRAEIVDAGASAIIISMLDEVAWLLNLVILFGHNYKSTVPIEWTFFTSIFLKFYHLLTVWHHIIQFYYYINFLLINVLDFVLQRGSDVPHSPVMYAYLLVRTDSAILFVDSSKVSPEAMGHLKNAGVELRPYDTVLSEIEG